MLSEMKSPNPLDVLGLREVVFLPDHFDYFDIPFRYNLEECVRDWISVNLKGRYFLGKNINLDKQTNKLVNTLTIGFEDPKELSYFMLGCPFLKYNG